MRPHRFVLTLALLVAGCAGGDRPDPATHLTEIAGPAGVIAVDDGGQGGVPIVFVHSLAGNAAQWSAQLTPLRATRRALAIELRGHGHSAPAPDGDYTIAAMSRDLAAVVDSLGLQRFVLVGHSLGGGVALAYAGMAPERVAGLVLVDPIGDGTKFPAEQVEPFLAQVEAEYDSVITRYWWQIAGNDSALSVRLLDDLRRTPRDVVIAAMKEALRFDPGPALARYRGPAFAIVTPQNDQPFSLHQVGKFPHRIVDGTGHWIQLERPAEFNRILDSVLAGW